MPSNYIDFYNDYYARILQSKAHAIFCEKVYGRNLCQEGMLAELQLDKLIEMLRESRGKNILELGCGNGMLAEYISDMTGSNVLGIDFSGEAIRQAKERTSGKRDKVSFSLCGIDDIDSARDRFDVVVAVDVLYDHFVEDISSVFRKIKAVINPGGGILVFQSFIAESDGVENLPAEKTYIGKALSASGFEFSVTDLTEDDITHWKLKIETAREMEALFEKEGNSDLCLFQINKAEKLLSYSEAGRGVRYFYKTGLRNKDHD